MNATLRNPLLIVVAGPSCTGKTTLSRRLGALLDLPVLGRDAIKERLFDILGVGDRAWSRQLGEASYEVLYYALDLLLQTQQDCIVESNFRGELAASKIRALQQQHHYRLCQIQCRTAPDVLLARLRRRAQSGERHPGHAEAENIDHFDVDNICDHYEPLALDGELIVVDTSRFDAVNYDSLVQAVNRRNQ